MCVCGGECVRACMHACVRMDVWGCVHACVRVLFVCAWVVCVLSTSVYACLCVCVRARVCVGVWAFMRGCVCVRLCICCLCFMKLTIQLNLTNVYFYCFSLVYFGSTQLFVNAFAFATRFFIFFP